MHIDNQQVQHIAQLACLKIDEREQEQLKKDLSNILAYFQKLDELDTTDVEPMKHVIETQNVLREDKVHPSLTQEQALCNAPKQDGQYFIVPNVFDD